MKEPGDISVEQAVACFLASPAVVYLRPGTVYEYQHELARFVRWLQSHNVTLSQVNARVVAEFVEYMRVTGLPRKVEATEISSYTLHSQVRVILTFLYWCLDDEVYSRWVKVETIRRIKAPKVIRVIIETFSVQQIIDLRKACAKEYDAHLRVRDEAILLLLLDTGIRASELCRLTIANVHLSPEDAYIKILGKGSKWGAIGMGETCRVAMNQYWNEFRQVAYDAALLKKMGDANLSGASFRRTQQQFQKLCPFFVNRYGEPLTSSGLGRLIQRLGEWAGIEGVRCSPHTFRHTFASMFMLNGGDIYVLSKLLRHTSVKTTENYLKSIRQWEMRYRAQSVTDKLFGGVNRNRKELEAQKPERRSVGQQETPEEYTQWAAFLRTWYERLDTTWGRTSVVLKRLSDVLPDSLHYKKGRAFRRSVLKLGTALRKHAGFVYGEEHLSIRSRPGQRGMNLWQVYQVCETEQDA